MCRISLRRFLLEESYGALWVGFNAPGSFVMARSPTRIPALTMQKKALPTMAPAIIKDQNGYLP